MIIISTLKYYQRFDTLLTGVGANIDEYWIFVDATTDIMHTVSMTIRFIEMNKSNDNELAQ